MRRSALLAAAAVTLLVACMSPEQRAVEAYVTGAQEIAEVLVEASSTFEALMDATPDPLQWTDATKDQIDIVLGTFRSMRTKAEAMAVPPAFTDVHPLLIQSLTEMSAAVEIIGGIARDPASGTEAKGDEMTAHAKNAEKVSGEYVQKLQETLEREYPEMMQED